MSTQARPGDGERTYPSRSNVPKLVDVVVVFVLRRLDVPQCGKQNGDVVEFVIGNVLGQETDIA